MNENLENERIKETSRRGKKKMYDGDEIKLNNKGENKKWSRKISRRERMEFTSDWRG
jgi:hypothetical protein